MSTDSGALCHCQQGALQCDRWGGQTEAIGYARRIIEVCGAWNGRVGLFGVWVS